MGLMEVVRQRMMNLEGVVQLKVDRMELLAVNQAPGRIYLVEAQPMGVHCMEMVHEL
jgi:hypothetical protein